MSGPEGEERLPLNTEGKVDPNELDNRISMVDDYRNQGAKSALIVLSN